MTDIDRLEQRLSAVERVVVDGDVTLDELSELTSMADTVAELETQIQEQERRLADLEASVQSIEGYVGNVESINDDVARQAAAATATADRLERRLDRLEVELDDLSGGLLETDDGGGDTDDRDGSTDGDGSDGTGSASDDVGGQKGTSNGERVFEFGTVAADDTDDVDADETMELERTVSGILEREDESQPIVDDGVDRPASSANQSTVDSAVGEEQSRGEHRPADENADTDADGGLFGSLRARLS